MACSNKKFLIFYNKYVYNISQTCGFLYLVFGYYTTTCSRGSLTNCSPDLVDLTCVYKNIPAARTCLVMRQLLNTTECPTNTPLDWWARTEAHAARCIKGTAGSYTTGNEEFITQYGISSIIIFIFIKRVPSRSKHCYNCVFWQFKNSPDITFNVSLFPFWIGAVNTVSNCITESAGACAG